MRIRLDEPFEDYAVDDRGRVWTYKRKHPRKLRPHLVYGGGYHGRQRTAYERVTLRGTDGTRKHALVHVLVCVAFHGRAQCAGLVVCHGDGDSQNNRPSNLRWGTVAENMEDRRRHAGRQ